MYYFIINPNSQSGNGIKIWNKVRLDLNNSNVAFKSYFTEYRCHATEIIQDLMTDDTPKTVIVLGGDGTINEVVNGINNTSCINLTLGYIPTGSSNDLARGLNISQNPINALNAILSSNHYVHRVDNGIITTKIQACRKFATSSGIGLDALICKDALDSKAKKILNIFKLGKLTYAAILIKQLFLYKPVNAVLTIDNNRKYHFKKMYLIAATIHPYEGGGMKISPNANPSDNLVDICVISGISRIKILFLFPSIFLGKHGDIKGVELLQCANAQIETDRKLYVHTDGEIFGEYDYINIGCTDYQLKMISGK